MPVIRASSNRRMPAAIDQAANGLGLERNSARPGKRQAEAGRASLGRHRVRPASRRLVGACAESAGRQPRAAPFFQALPLQRWSRSERMRFCPALKRPFSSHAIAARNNSPRRAELPPGASPSGKNGSQQKSEGGPTGRPHLRRKGPAKRAFLEPRETPSASQGTGPDRRLVPG